MPLTGLVVTILIICLGIYDLVMVVVRGTGSSVSDFLTRAGFKGTLVPYTFGFVCGHLFGKMTPVGATVVEQWVYVGCAFIVGFFVGYGVRNLIYPYLTPKA